MARTRLVIDCGTGTRTVQAFTAEEELARDAEEAAATLARQEEEAKTTERDGATSDLATQYTLAITRLDEIIAEAETILASNASVATKTLAAQNRDMARIQKRTLRLLKAMVT